MSAPPRVFDRSLHARRLARAASRFEAADFLHRRASEDLADRLEAVTRTFERALVLGARRGALAGALDRSRVEWVVEADLSASMLAGRAGSRVVLDEERLPFGEASFDLVIAPLSLHWVNDLVGALVQIRRALTPGGLFLGALLGGASLIELRECLTVAEIERRGGAGMRVSPMLRLSDAPGLLQRAGFADPVADSDALTVRYAHPLALLKDLRDMGEASALVDRPAAPLDKVLLDDAMRLYGERFSDPDGRVRATFEFVNLTGWRHPT